MFRTATLLALCIFQLNVHAQVLRQPIPDKLIVLTFDDAPKTHYSFVAPLLKKYGFGATFFVCEFPPDFNDTTMYMTWKQIQQLDKMGFEVASHTKTHTHVNKMSKSRFIEELQYIENKCDSLNIPRPVNFAYPGYDTDSNAIRVLKEKKYQFARAGGNRTYDPIADHPYLMPGFTTTANNKDEIMNALAMAKDGKITVLTIHGVPDYAHDWVTTPPGLFKEYLQYMYDNHFHVISMKELSRYINVDKALNVIKPDFTKKLK